MHEDVASGEHSVVSFATVFSDDHRRVWEEACDALLVKVEALRDAAIAAREVADEKEVDRRETFHRHETEQTPYP